MSRAIALTKEGGLAWEKPKGRARGKHKPGEMNGTEAAYARLLDTRVLTGELQCYWFEAFTFKLAKDCRYTPDFIVMLPDGLLECHETKGFWQDDAKVKIRCASHMFPFRFVALRKLPKKDGGGWAEEEF